MTEILSSFLPAAMMVLMLSLGLKLDPGEVSRALRHPRALAVGLLVQIVGLPLIAFAVALGFGLEGVLLAGLILVAASPGGVTSNYAALLVRGSVGLSVSMTFVTSIAAPITLPLVLVATTALAPEAGGLWKISLGMTGVALVPLLFGLAATRAVPRLSARASKLLDPLAKLLFLAMVLATFAQNWSAMQGGVAGTGPAVTLFALLAPALAFAAAKLARVTPPERRTLMVEATMQNVAVTIFVASTLLDQPGLAIPGLIYAVEMNVVALLVVGGAHLAARRKGLRPTAS
ncbi:MAG TPA: hypothetical protein DIU07_19795 [Rhodobacteraceae bacterium]|nr:hypothetical protein [Paracoccaceae bacterium]